MTEIENQGPWYQRISASGVPNLVAEILAQLESRPAADSVEQDQIDRQRRIAETIGWEIENADPMLIADSTINRLADHLRQSRDHLGQWISSGASEYLVTHAAAQFDETITVLATIPLTPSSAASSAEITTLRRSVGQHRSQVDREIEELRAASTTAQEQFTGQAQQARTRVAELESEVTRLQEELRQIVASARDQGNQQQNAFTTAQTERQETFSRMLEEKREETAAAATDLQKEISKELARAKSTVESELSEVVEAKIRVEEILGIVGEEALIGTYSKNADQDRKEANKWRWIAIGAALVVVAVGVWIVKSTVGTGTDWELFAAKVVLALPIAGAAAYAAKQSSEHRYAQREAEHIALQLATLKPYLNDLEKPDDRDELLGKIAHRLFGQPRRHYRKGDISELSDGPGALNQVIVLLQELTKFKP